MAAQLPLQASFPGQCGVGDAVSTGEQSSDGAGGAEDALGAAEEALERRRALVCNAKAPEPVGFKIDAQLPDAPEDDCLQPTQYASEIPIGGAQTSPPPPDHPAPPQAHE